MPARVVDLRSDTVTHPTPAMREAMACAEVGDDGHGEDPTVQRLETLAAERLGKEAAVLVSSGTMGNLVGALTQTAPGDTMIVGAYCHPSLKAAAGIAVYGGVKPYEIPTERGRMDPADVRAAIRTVREADGGHPTLLCLENTHNQQHGSPTQTRRRSGTPAQSRTSTGCASTWTAPACSMLPSRWTCRPATSLPTWTRSRSASRRVSRAR